MEKKLTILIIALFYISNCEMNILSDDDINAFLKYNFANGSGYGINATNSYEFGNNRTDNFNVTNGYGNNTTDSFNTTFEYGNNRTDSSNRTGTDFDKDSITDSFFDYEYGPNRTIKVNSTELNGNSSIFENNSTYPKERDGYKFYPGYGYYKFHHASTWENAKYICEMEGGYLSVINSRAEANLLLKIYNSNPKYNTEQFWLGFSRQHGSFYTVKGNTLGYVDWASGQPDNYGGIENCGTLRTEDGRFNDYRCDKWLNYFCDKN